MSEREFTMFPKIPRLSRQVVITEKIDGTNAQILIDDDGFIERVGSRKRWITPNEDNFGFAAWCMENRDELQRLGPGLHYGEWWGSGIGRRYDLDEKRFSLFNTGRWTKENVPNCCHIVPVLYTGEFCTTNVRLVLNQLAESGSVAAPGFMKPEGVIIYHIQGGVYFKKTIEKDEVPKFLADQGKEN